MRQYGRRSPVVGNPEGLFRDAQRIAGKRYPSSNSALTDCRSPARGEHAGKARLRRSARPLEPLVSHLSLSPAALRRSVASVRIHPRSRSQAPREHVEVAAAVH